MSKEKIIDTIIKILAKADKSRNPSHEEAESAILMAQRLMAKHGIEAHEVECPTAEDEDQIVQTTVREGCKTDWIYLFLLNTISDNFRVKSFTAYTPKTATAKRHTMLRFFGRKADVIIAANVYRHAVSTMENECHIFLINSALAECKTPVKILKNSFKAGFVSGLKEKLAAQVASECMALVLRTDAGVEKKFDELGTKNVNSKSSSQFDMMANFFGHRAGKNYNYSHGELTQ